MDKNHKPSLPQYFMDLRHCAGLFDETSFAGKNVLITGASGLLGRTLVELFSLLPGCNVFALVRGTRLQPPFSGRCALVTGGLHALQNMHVMFDYVVHCASPSDPLSFKKKPVEVLHVNMEHCHFLLEMLREQNYGKLCNVSSGEVYGAIESQDKVFTEQDVCAVDAANVRNCYPIAKIASEAQCTAYTAQYGVDCFVARPCHIFGPNFKQTDSHAVCNFLQKAHYGQQIILNSFGLKSRNYIYVVDVATAIAHLLLVANAGDVYNIASDDIISINDIAGIIAKLGGVDIVIKPKGGDKYSIQRNVLSNKKILQSGWKQQFTLLQALKNTFESLEYFHSAVNIIDSE